MSGLKISQLSPATTLDGTELSPLVQGGTTKIVTVNQLAARVLASMFVGASVVVNSYADLPTASSYTNKFAWVLNSTGMLFSKKPSGWYLSNGSTWVDAEPPTSAASGITVDSTGFHHSSHNDLQDVLSDLDAAIPGALSPGGAAGNVQYFNGALLAGSDNLFWDEADICLGIATATPAFPLDVNGAARVAQLITTRVNTDLDTTFMLGNGASATGFNALAIGAQIYGTGAVASGDQSLALGGGDDNGNDGAHATGDSAFALGAAATASGDYSFAIGTYATAAGYAAFALNQGFANGYASSALIGGTADADNSIALGAGAFAEGTGSLVIAPTPNALAYGRGATSILIGSGQTGTAASYAVALGNSVNATGLRSTALGNRMTVSGSYSVGFNTATTANTLGGDNSFGIVMTAQGTRTLTASNTFGIYGGNFIFDPRTSPTGNISTTQASFDLSRATDAIIVPTGTAAQRPAAGVNGMIRYNSSAGTFEGYSGGVWKTFTST